MSCYLLYSGYCQSASEACRLFGNKRTVNGKGVTIPRYDKRDERQEMGDREGVGEEIPSSMWVVGYFILGF